MEYTQWDKNTSHYILLQRLNPCCNGIYSMSYKAGKLSKHQIESVLILVVMEYTQWVMLLWNINNPNRVVLILVVMEYTQWDQLKDWSKWKESLNPCCNGIYSMRVKNILPKKIRVLILVVMEYTQWVFDYSKECDAELS